MSRNSLLISLCIIAFAAMMTSCNKDYEAPEYKKPSYNGKPANKTIADIKAMHNLESDQVDSICKWDETFIVEAVVVSTDEGGNYYKSMVVQDATGGIEIELDRTGLYNDFPVGQKVYLICNGLVVGDYGGLYQMGWIYDGSVGRINSQFIDKYLIRDGLPTQKDIPAPIEITTAGGLAPENVNRLVTLKNVVFEEAAMGQPFADDNAITNRNIASINGNKVTNMVVRTSNYAKFRSTRVPSTPCDLTGILTLYNSTYQLMIRVKEDIKALPQYEEKLIKDLTFNENSLNGEWKAYSSEGSEGWKFQKTSSDQFVYHLQASTACEDWLVSPEISLSSTGDLTVRLDHQNDIVGLQESFQCYYSTNYTEGETIDPTQWTAFDPNVEQFPSQFSLSNPMQFKAGFQPNNFRIAIRYHNTGDAPTSRWMVRGVKIYELKKD
ncbi:MAG: choice-of-anchor J domain-containing protein [Bacteroidales bacterium]|nr:choice-of-anchor J domain-containing protein [Bacteroidales bacterium]